jgi:tetratricopeptide (TPR) repeat protein
VTIFSKVHEVKIDEELKPADPRGKKLLEVIELCEQVLAVSPDQGAGLAAVYDLRGMAQTRLGDFYPAMASHRRAMRHAWGEYCRARQSDVARPTGQPVLAEHARANATAALHSLALAYERRAALARKKRKEKQEEKGWDHQPRQSPREWLDRSTSQGLFKWAGRRAGDGSVVSASSRFERGAALEHAGKYPKAAAQFEEAARIQPLNPEYRARRAKALAKRVRRRRRPWRKMLMKTGRTNGFEKEALKCSQRAVRLLARPFSLAVVPFTPETLDLQCNATLAALKKAYEVLCDLPADDERPRFATAGKCAVELERIEDVEEMKTRIDRASAETDGETGSTIKRGKPAEGASELGALLKALPDDPDLADDPDPADGLDLGLPAWQRDQVELAIGRLCAEIPDWEQALAPFTELVKRLTKREEVDRLIEFSAYAHKARALRESARAKVLQKVHEGREPDREKELAGYVGALKTAAEGVRRDPLNVEARREAGRAHFALGQYSDALASWEHALWLSPSDPYLHYEVGMCHRHLAKGQADKAEHRRLSDCAKWHFDRARELFDGEDLDGEAWTRFWHGKIALEEGQPAEALGYLQGAEHGPAEAAAALLAGEAHLTLDQRPAAEHAFDRCAKAVQRMTGQIEKEKEEGEKPEIHPTIDWLWGDELPWEAVEARIDRGRAEAKYLAPGDWQDEEQAKEAELLLKAATVSLDKLKDKDPDAKDAAMPRVLDTYGLLLRVRGDIDEALDRVRERLRYEKTSDALRVEAELLDLHAEWGKALPEEVLTELAADHTWQAIPGNGRPKLPRATLRRRASGTIRTQARRLWSQ